jgi:hypothetical protein
MHQGRRKGRGDLLQRRTVRESTGHHHRRERPLDVDRPPETGPHLNGASPGVEVEGPRGVAIAAVRGTGGGVAAGTTTAAATVGSAAVMPPLSAARLS